MTVSTNKKIALPFVLILSLFVGNTHADTDSTSIRHYKGADVGDYQQATSLLKTYNETLQAILKKETLTSTDAGNIHKLTYTLENALEKMRSDIVKTAEILEELHLSSERNDVDKMKKFGNDYLSRSNQMLTF
ncbi:hypothetical protein FKG94_08945 [Exilibacterium tricleocarpae]|uniref:Uncharacterized protein n=1 Tax=Exilibacterium tricleocarpae TaxID=2591008 RepID=A0A545TVH3_9GAMM|nr:DUF6746 family protein [Exilibacterium tricleocarpae]TQV81220.1 hypothetical protein FKG94_08945 [Exilibacterium tricleocarpae]